MTGFVPVMWSIWGLLVVLLAAVNLYASRLARDEEDQIFLSEGFTEERSAQAAIAEKVNKIEPYKRLALWMLGAMTVFVVGYYIFDVIRQFK
jgi:anaerobic C4-dicarboxylate transporter